jgi:TRAP-type mannitol/chloroaromatic compound transport system permease small subunit
MFWVSLIMVAIGIVNVVTRYVGRTLGISLGGTLYITLQTYAYNLIFLLGAAYVLKVDGHVRVDIIFSSLRDRTKAWIDIIFTFLFLFPFCGFGIYLSQRYVQASWAQREVNIVAGGIPVYPIKTVIIIGFALLILQGISEVIKRVDFLRGGRPSMYQSHITDQTEAV